MYENTGTRAHLMAAELIEAGVDVHAIYRRLYEDMPFAKLELLSRALHSVTRFDDGRLTFTCLSRDDFEESGAEESYSEGIIDHLRSVEGTKVAALARELAPNGKPKRKKVSLRATDGVGRRLGHRPRGRRRRPSPGRRLLHRAGRRRPDRVPARADRRAGLSGPRSGGRQRPAAGAQRVERERHGAMQGRLAGVGAEGAADPAEQQLDVVHADVVADRAGVLSGAQQGAEGGAHARLRLDHAGHLADQRDRLRQRAVGRRAARRVEHERRQAGRRVGILQALAGAGLEPLEAVDDDRGDEVLAGGERAVDGRLADAGAARHLGHARVDAALGEDLARGGDHALAVAQRVAAPRDASGARSCGHLQRAAVGRPPGAPRGRGGG